MTTVSVLRQLDLRNLRRCFPVAQRWCYDLFVLCDSMGDSGKRSAEAIALGTSPPVTITGMSALAAGSSGSGSLDANSRWSMRRKPSKRTKDKEKEGKSSSSNSLTTIIRNPFKPKKRKDSPQGGSCESLPDMDHMPHVVLPSSSLSSPTGESGNTPSPVKLSSLSNISGGGSTLAGDESPDYAYTHPSGMATPDDGDQAHLKPSSLLASRSGSMGELSFGEHSADAAVLRRSNVRKTKTVMEIKRERGKGGIWE